MWRKKLTLEAVRRFQPFNLRVDCKLTLRLCDERNDDFAHQPEGPPERKMPRGSLVRNHIAQVIIQNINDLII